MRPERDTRLTMMGNTQRPEVDWTYGSAKDDEAWMIGIVLQVLLKKKKKSFQYYFIDPQCQIGLPQTDLNNSVAATESSSIRFDDTFFPSMHGSHELSVSFRFTAKGVNKRSFRVF